MARQISLITFTGKLRNMIGYYRNGKYFLRSTPETVRQTTASRRAARRFGIASKKGALIRRAFNNELDVHCDNSHINRLNRALIQAPGNNPEAITGFRFNKDTGTDRFFSIAPKISKNGMLQIPAQTLPLLKGITALEVKVIAARINFVTHQVVGTDAATIIVDLREPFEGIAQPIHVPGTGILLVTLQVRAINRESVSSDRKYLAADIIAVQAPAPPQTIHKSQHFWPTMAEQQPEEVLFYTYAKPFLPVVQRE
jgi:hypothetical protein